jgi:hypothetical protein
MELPWRAEQATWLIERAGKLALAGAEPVGPLVLPTAHFFPDRMDGSPEAFGRLFDRMKGHVGLDAIETELLIVDPEANEIVSSCSSGACGSKLATWNGARVVPRDAGESYAVHLAMPELSHPTVVTTVLARALGDIFLRESGVKAGGKERAAIGDLAASMLGLAVLVANGSGIEVKGCGGVKVESVTSLTAPLACLAVALVERRETLRNPGVERAPLLAHLDNVGRELYPAAAAFAKANDDVVRRLDDAPASLAEGQFSLREPRTSVTERLRSLFGLSAGSTDPIVALERELREHGSKPGALPPAARSSRSRADLAEIRALVDESFK